MGPHIELERLASRVKAWQEERLAIAREMRRLSSVLMGGGADVESSTSPAPKRRKRISADGRARMSLAQKARQARQRQEQATPEPANDYAAAL